MKRRLKLHWLGLILIGFASCSKESTSGDDNNNGNGNGGGTVDCSSVAKTFSADVNPIIQATCTTALCHANGSINGPGTLTTYNSIFASRSDIRAAVKSGAMPQGTTLAASKINTILCWIDSGAPNN
ncbi:MAG: hypothetical protein ABI761_08630 [Saprospiraceae bacterium]